MKFNTVFKSTSAAIAFLAFGALGASAQVAGCDITELSSATGELYLEAQNELLVNDNPQGALQGLNKLKSQPLNCYEEGAVLGLSAQVKLDLGDTLGAIQDLRTQVDKGYVQPQDKLKVMKVIWQLYFQEEKLQEGIAYSKRWISAGGRPSRDEKWSFAIAHNNAGDFNGSIPWAEQVLQADGRNAPESVTQFLIFLYDKTGQHAKKAALIERLLEQNPTERKYWDAIAGDYQRGGNEAKAFEVQKAMYLGGILKTEDELERIVNFYNLFDAPYEAARVLEKEMNAGRISKSYEKLELLVNLYQVAREHEKAIPIIQQAAAISSNGAMYERLGRSYADLQEWAKAEEALTQALNKGGVKDRGLAWVQIGQSRFERDDRAGAREAFRKANNRGGRGWLGFMDSEEATAKALRVFEAANKVQELENETKACDRLKVLGDNLPDGCLTLTDRMDEAQAVLVKARAS